MKAEWSRMPWGGWGCHLTYSPRVEAAIAEAKAQPGGVRAWLKTLRRCK